MVIVLLVGSPPPAESAGEAHAAKRRCGADQRTAHVRDFARSLLCLHNRERRAHGLRSLRPSRVLVRAAHAHAGDMVRGHYFDHVSRLGRTVSDRVGRAGYGRARGFAVGENIFYGLPPLPTPGQVFAAWMASAGHRSQVLNGRWRELGLGIVMRAPVRGRRGVTVVAVFGARPGH
jgi:uncharacterized protein YkwD